MNANKACIKPITACMNSSKACIKPNTACMKPYYHIYLT